MPTINYINRILSVDVFELDTETNKLSIQIELEWGDGVRWKDTLHILI